MRAPFNLPERWLRKDAMAGALMFAIGLAVMAQASTYPLGTLAHMGPGFFPSALGVLLALIGVAIALSRPADASSADARETHAAQEPARKPEWRGWACITAGIVSFIVLGHYGGLLPATFGVVFISALGDRDNTVRSAACLALAISVVCVVVFWWALKIQLPLFQWGQ
ncbi:tripartite tricarboxylate transporter TctB family protein [Caballeronia sp. LZ065]|uniref:tripartite tricarboxylate transporter TctB family protein n=1 Tax=Caballeronia sp. LZ065 TaxID=3038571 RepID=UPI002863990B|nr:tripartite tricarboxylate transporter TctB family protein [Caballeronia sp. LZ065]MDR5781258.1 tripartite tricarboxylate transporter TctB family protein [Caballeronia sp. LZ065]